MGLLFHHDGLIIPSAWVKHKFYNLRTMVAGLLTPSIMNYWSQLIPQKEAFRTSQTDMTSRFTSLAWMFCKVLCSIHDVIHGVHFGDNAGLGHSHKRPTRTSTTRTQRTMYARRGRKWVTVE